MIHSGVISGRPCPVCQKPGHVCGDDHMRRGPVDNIVQEGVSVPEPQELKEYQYVVNNTVTTAMLTPAMAERLGAKPVGSDDAASVGGYSSEQNAAVYATTGMSGAVVGGDAVKPVRPQQRGVDELGRTKSMRSPKEQGQVGTEDESTTESAARPDALAKTRKAQDK